MDPNETLARMLNLVRDYNEAVEARDAENETVKEYEAYEDVLLAVAEELPGLVEAMHEWLSAGGYPPEVWRQGPDAHAVGDDWRSADAVTARIDPRTLNSEV